MTVSSGFFNSQNHDRLYDAEQFSSVFDGVILDGVYQGVGDAFKVTAYPDANNTVIVGTGRAWFDHTWTVNDSQYSIVLAEPNIMLGRIDAIVLDIDRRSSVRKNSIKYVQGALASAPEHPVLIKEELHNQYPLAYITIQPGKSAPINQMYIENKVGTSDCPLVTGVLESMDSDMFTQQMEAKFEDWFEGIKSSLEGDIALNLQNQINNLKDELNEQASLLPSDEVYSFAQNATAKVVQMNPSDFSAKLYSWILPDGYIATLGGKYDSGVVCAALNISTSDGVSVGSTVIDRSDAAPASLERGDKQVASVCYISKSGDEYPVTYQLATFKWAFSSKPLGEVDSSPYMEGIYVSVFSVTITKDHVVSVSNTGNSDKITANDKIYSDYTVKQLLGTLPAILNDGSRVISYAYPTGKQYQMDDRTGKFGAVKISSQGTVTAISDISTVSENSTSYDPPLCFTDQTNSFVYVGTQQSIVGGYYQSYKDYGKIYNTNLEDVTDTLGIDTAIIPPSNISTYVSDRYFTKPDMKTYVKISGPTYKIEETKTYPPFMQITFGMNGSVSSSQLSYAHGFVSNDEALAIISSATNSRGAIIGNIGMSVYKDLSASISFAETNTTFVKSTDIIATSDAPIRYKDPAKNKYYFMINPFAFSVRSNDYSQYFPLVGIHVTYTVPTLLIVSF